MRPVIIVFAKAPARGCVKTRLAARLGEERAARLHEAFVADTIEKARGLADVELHTDVATGAWMEFPVVRRLQCPGDLGARMLAALDTALGEGRPQAMILGSDAPSLPAGHLEALLASGADVALGPAEDGGYYAIACRVVKKNMFAGVNWSSAKTMRETIAAVRACGLSVAIGPSSFDVDTPADLARLMAIGEELPAHTRRFFEGLVLPGA